MLQRSLLPVAVLLCAAWPAAADPISYEVTVNTSSISGDPGSLDFQFNPGPLVSEPATLQILSFASNGTLNPPAFPTGDVTGTLPGTLSFDNLTQFNDYFEAFTFGTALSFEVSISGAAGGTSGSTFAFSMFSDPAGTIPLLTTDPNGFAFTEDLNTDGTTTATNVSPQVGSTAVPEPSALLLLITVLLGLGWTIRRRLVS
jgi:hypothetical protein